METLKTMEILIDSDFLLTLVGQYLLEWIKNPFPYGLLLGASLELFGYGIFKAVSLLNIKY
jgi:hypothetical protein